MRTAAVCDTCATYINAVCVLYTGPRLSTFDINTKDSVHDALIKINNWAMTGMPGMDNTFLNLNDTNEITYSGQKGKHVVVSDDETGLEFQLPYWIRIDDADVHKGVGNTDINTIEDGDIVQNMLFVINGLDYILPYGKYDSSLGPNTLPTSYLTYIIIN